MKPRRIFSAARLSFPLATALVALFNLAAPSASAATYYWDSDGTTPGYGSTTGTWGANAFWTVTAAGGSPHSAVTTTLAADLVNFGNATLNYNNAAVSVALGGVTATSITFGAGQTTDLTIGALTGQGTITLAGPTRTIQVNSSGHKILSTIALTGATTVNLNWPGGGVDPSPVFTLGALSGTGGLTLQNTAGSNPNPATFVLSGASTYTGNTLLTSTTTNASVQLTLGVANALPATTVLTIDGGAGSGSGRAITLNMSGKDQTLAGLTSVITGTLRGNRVLNSSATLSQLTIDGSTNTTYAGQIGNGGANIRLIKSGTGTFTLSGVTALGTNTYTGGTILNQGTLTVTNDGTTTSGTLGATTGALTVNNNNTTAAGTNAILNLATGVDTAVGTLSGTISTPLSGTNTATINTQASRTFTVNQTAAGTYAGAINGAGAFTLGSLSTNTLTLTGRSTLTGNVTVSAGTLVAGINASGVNTALGNASTGGRTISVGAATLRFDSGNVLSTNFSSNTVPSITVTGGTLTNGSTATNNALGNLTLAGGTLSAAIGTGSGSGYGNWNLNGTVTSTGTSTISNASSVPITLSAATGTNTTFDVTSGTLTASAALGQVTAIGDEKISGLTKSGAGAMILSGNNSFTGGVTINAGTLTLANAGALNSTAGSENAVTFGASSTGTLALGGNSVVIRSLNSNATPGTPILENANAGNAILTIGNSLNLASSFAGVIQDGTGGGTLGLIKAGTNTLTLSGDNSYTGATLVSDGTLTLASAGDINSTSGITINGSGAKFLQTSSAAVSPVVTLTQGTLTGSGTVDTVNVGAGTGGIISNNNGVGGAALTIGNLTLAGAANLNLFSLAGNTSSTLDVTGTLTTAGTAATITANNAGGWVNGSTYTLLTYGGGAIAGSADNFLHAINNLTPRQSGTWGGNGTSNITLAISGDNPFWTGSVNNKWNTSADQNWELITAGTPTNFLASDIVLFDDNADGAGTVTVEVDLADVSPTSTIFANSTRAYQIDGIGLLGIANGSLTVNGGGTVTLNTATNAYSGATAVSNGTLNLNGSLSGGGAVSTSGTGVLNQGAASVISGASSYTQSSSGTSTLAGANSYTGTTGVSAGTLNLNGSLTGGGAVSTSGTGILNQGAASIISGASTFTQGSSGTSTLAGINSYTGATTVSAGSLVLSNANTITGATSVAGTATLQLGHATSMGTSTMTLASGATLQLRNDVNTTFTAPIATPVAGVTYNFDVNQATGAGTGRTLSLGAINFAIGSNNTINVTGGNGYTLALGPIGAPTGAVAGTGNTINATTAAVTTTKYAAGSFGSALLLQGGNSISLANFEMNSNGNNSITVSGAGTVATLGSTTQTNTRAGGNVSYTLTSGTLNLTTTTSLANIRAASGTINAPTFTINSGTLNNTSGAALALAASPGTGTVAGSPNMTINGDFAFTGTHDLNLGLGTVSLGTTAGTSRTITANASNLTLGGIISNGTTANKVIKDGAGILTLNGANTYTGGTDVTAGTLVIGSTGALANGAIGLTNGGSTFAVRPAAGTVSLGNTGTVGAGATLSLGSGTIFSMVDGAIGTTNLVQEGTFATNALTLNGAILNFELSGATVDKLAVTGALATASVSGVNTINLTPLAALTAGTYNLITTANVAGGLSTGGTFAFANGLTTTVGTFAANNYLLTLNNSANIESVTVGAASAMTWTGQTAGNGATDANWNTTGSTNFALGTTPVAFNTGNAVTFQDANTVATGNVAAPSLAVVIQAGGVSPGSTTFNNSAVDYTVSNASGVIGIAGTGGLTKLGTGMVTLSGTNTYTGATAINAGTLTLSGSGTLGTGSALTLGGGKLDLGATSQTVGAVFVTAAAASGDTILNGSLTGTSYAASNPTGNAIISANLLVNSTAGFTKSGAGAVTLSGANTFTGATSISAGTLRLANASAVSGTPSITLTAAGATLQVGTDTAFSGPRIVSTAGTIVSDRATTGAGPLGVGLTHAFSGVSRLGSGNTNITAGSNVTNGTPAIQFASLDNDNGSTANFGLNPTTANVIVLGGVKMGDINTGTANFTLGGTGSVNSIGGAIINGTRVTANLIKSGTSTWTLSGANTYNGTTAVNGGLLILDYSSQNNTKLADGAVLSLGGGTLDLSGGTHTETVLSTTLTAGTASRVTSSVLGSVLQMNVITPDTGASIDFGADNIANTDTLNTSGILGTWATVNGADWAMNSGSATPGGATVPGAGVADGFIRAYTGYTDVTRLDGTPALQIINDGSTTNVRIVEGTGSAANLTLGAAVTTINTLNQSALATPSLATIDLAGQTLATNSILVGTGASGLTIGNGVNNGFLSAVTAAGDLSLINSTANDLTINSIVADNATSTLTKSGIGRVILTGVNAYAGSTTVFSGTLQISGAGSLGAGTYGAAITNNGTLQYSSSAAQILSGAITGTGGLTKDTDASILTLSSATTAYTGATIISAGTLVLAMPTSTSPAAAFASPVTVNAGTTLQFSPTGNSSMNGVGAISLVGTLTYAPATNHYQVVGTSGANKIVTVSGGASIINISPGGTFAASNGGLYLDGGLQGSSALTVNATTDGFGLVLRTAGSTYSGTMTVNGNANIAPGTGSGLVLNGSGVNSTLSNANLTINGTLELGDSLSGMGWAPTGTITGTTQLINALNGTGVVVANMKTAASIRTLSVGNSGGSGNFSGVIANGVNNTLGFTKAGSGTQTLSGLSATAANNYSGITTVDNGTLAFTTTSPSFTGGLRFGSAATNITPGILDLTTSSATFAGALLVNTNSVTANEIKIGAAQTLTFNGNVQIGATTPVSGVNAVSRLDLTGGGTFNVATAAAGTFFVGGSTLTSLTTSQDSTLDLTALSATTINTSTTGTIRVSAGSSSNVSGYKSTLLLPAPAVADTVATATLTAGTIGVGVGSGFNSAAGQINTLRLGTGLTTLNANTINVGTGSRDIGQIIFGGAGGDVIIRAADGTSRATLIAVGTGGNTATSEPATNNLVDFSSHDADILVTSLNVGNQNRSGNLTSEFKFGAGDASLTSTLDATNVNIGFRFGTTTALNVLTNRVVLSGGTVTFGNVGATGTGVDIGNNTNATDFAHSTVGELNISGGNVTINNGSGGFAVRLGTNTNTAGDLGTVTAAMNLTGGTTTLGGDLVKGAVSPRTTSTLVLNGASAILDMGGNDITSLDTITYTNGTLKNLGTVNTGMTLAGSGSRVFDQGTGVNGEIQGAITGTGVGLTKDGLGKLTLSGTNSYDGGTTITAGTLLMGDAAGDTFATSGVTVASNATLGGSGTISGTLGVSGNLAPGATGVDIQTLAAGTTTWNGGSNLWQFDLSASAGSSDLLAITGDFNKGSAGAYKFDFMGSAPATWGNAYTLATWTNATTFDASDFTFQGLGGSVNGIDSYFTINGNSLIFTAVPEPSSALAGLLIAAGLLRRRRGKKVEC